MAALSEWLQLMLAEIARKRDDLEHARAEEARRVAETAPPSSPPTAKVTSVQEARAARR
jgi:hypothetical protein